MSGEFLFGEGQETTGRTTEGNKVSKTIRRPVAEHMDRKLSRNV